MGHPEHELASTLAEAARRIGTTATPEEALEAIVQSARTSIPGIDEVGISVVHRDGSIETRAATGELVWTLDGLQYDLGEGPCLEAMREGRLVATEDVLRDERWPRYADGAAAEGLRAQVGVQLWAEDATIGGLNLYSTQADSIGEDSVVAAELFATHAAVALGHAQQVEELHRGMESRGVIGTAIGIVMERHRVDRQRAFQFLTRVSMDSNQRLRAVAQEVVQRAEAGYPSAR